MSKILFLDLDGTVRQAKSGATFINDPYDQELIPGVVEAIAKYSTWTVVGVTNQAGVEAHKKTLDDCIKEQMYTMQLLPQIQCINLCTTFNGSDGYRCYSYGDVINLPSGRNYRKPSAGMLMQFIEDYHSLPLEEILMVGDRAEDEQCARNAEINFIWAEDWRNGK